MTPPLIVAILGTALLASCAVSLSPVTPDYAGPTATIRDSASSDTVDKVDFFFVTEVDSMKIKTSLEAAREYNYGNGWRMPGLVIDRKVPAKTLRVKLEGRTAYEAPILEIINAPKIYHVEKTIEFDAKPMDITLSAGN